MRQPTLAYPDTHFYIDPKETAEALAGRLMKARFCLLTGHRQSGKSTICHAVQRFLDDNQDKFQTPDGYNPDDGFEQYLVTFDISIATRKGSQEFWRTLCARFHTVNPERFDFDSVSASAATFCNFFSKTHLRSPKPVILLVDEASRLSIGDLTYEFLGTLRALKDDRRSFCLHSLVLVGTESIMDFLLSRPLPNARSTVSPFSPEACFRTNRFTEEETKELFRQFGETFDQVDHSDIAEDVFELTAGHKGLVGVCGYFLERLKDYNESLSLPGYKPVHP